VPTKSVRAAYTQHKEKKADSDCEDLDPRKPVATKSVPTKSTKLTKSPAVKPAATSTWGSMDMSEMESTNAPLPSLESTNAPLAPLGSANLDFSFDSSPQTQTKNTTSGLLDMLGNSTTPKRTPIPANKQPTPIPTNKQPTKTPSASPPADLFSGMSTGSTSASTLPDLGFGPSSTNNASSMDKNRPVTSNAASIDFFNTTATPTQQPVSAPPTQQPVSAPPPAQTPIVTPTPQPKKPETIQDLVKYLNQAQQQEYKQRMSMFQQQMRAFKANLQRMPAPQRMMYAPQQRALQQQIQMYQSQVAQLAMSAKRAQLQQKQQQQQRSSGNFFGNNNNMNMFSGMGTGGNNLNQNQQNNADPFSFFNN
jgi:hypothetical protein